MSSNKRAGVIGIGGIGKWHGQMMRDTKRMDVVAVCDANPAMEAVAEEQFPGAAFYTDYAVMLKKAKLDLVAVVTPHNLHAPIAIAALKAGANVIVEKPMATSYAECVAMMAAAEDSGCFLTVFHNRRLDGWYLSAKRVIDDGLLGNLFEINVGINFRPGPNTWRGWKATNGGLMFDWGAHLVDYALHFAASPVRGVSGYFYRNPALDAGLNEDHGSIRLFFENGAIANVTNYGTNRADVRRYHLIGDRGSLVDDWNWGENDCMTVYSQLSGGQPVTMTVPYAKTVPQKYYDNIAAALYGEEPIAVTAASSARIIDIFCTAERSHAQGGAVLPLEGLAMTV
jgi:scyllo-inositol 2-dehydrogenase (NADP+)